MLSGMKNKNIPKLMKKGKALKYVGAKAINDIKNISFEMSDCDEDEDCTLHHREAYSMYKK